MQTSTSEKSGNSPQLAWQVPFGLCIAATTLGLLTHCLKYTFTMMIVALYCARQRRDVVPDPGVRRQVQRRQRRHVQYVLRWRCAAGGSSGGACLLAVRACGLAIRDEA